MQDNLSRGSETRYAHDCMMAEDVVDQVAIQQYIGDGDEADYEETEDAAYRTTESNADECSEGQEELGASGSVLREVQTDAGAAEEVEAIGPELEVVTIIVSESRTLQSVEEMAESTALPQAVFAVLGFGPRAMQSEDVEAEATGPDVEVLTMLGSELREWQPADEAPEDVELVLEGMVIFGSGSGDAQLNEEIPAVMKLEFEVLTIVGSKSGVAFKPFRSRACACACVRARGTAHPPLSVPRRHTSLSRGSQPPVIANGVAGVAYGPREHALPGWHYFGDGRGSAEQHWLHGARGLGSDVQSRTCSRSVEVGKEDRRERGPPGEQDRRERRPLLLARGEDQRLEDPLPETRGAPRQAH